ncbi:MAG: PAS domain-containing protein, partial [Dehalococcoidales bacterium]|nr:PAS domain-containing protein [Dehalococcoidales bacterium]
MLNSEAEQVRRLFYQLKSHSSNNESREELERAREELRKTRDEIAALKQFQSFITASSSDAVITTDKDLNITGWNQAAEDLLGWRAEEIIAGNTSEQARAAILQVLTEEVVNSLTEKSVWMGETVTFTRDNRRLTTRISIGVIWDNAGKFNGEMIIHHPDSISRPSGADFEKRVKERTDELI